MEFRKYFVTLKGIKGMIAQPLIYARSLEDAEKQAKEYIKSDMAFARRWGYVMFMPTLVKDESKAEDIIKLFKDDDEYYVQMAEAWLISYLGIYAPETAFKYIKGCPLKYNIIGKGIQKICDSFRVSDEWKDKFKSLRKLYK